MEGSGSGSVIEPLLALEREDVTGTLEFRANGVSTLFYARSGEVGFASGGAIGETLGRMLVRLGRIEEDHAVSVVHHMIDRLVEREEVRYGELLVDFGFLAPGELDVMLARQVREKMIGCILRGRGDWVLRTDDPRLAGAGSFVVGVRPTLVDAARRFSERRLEEVLSLSTPRYPEIVAPDGVVAAEFELSPEENAVLRDLDGTASISFLRSKHHGEELLPVLAALALGGGITLRVTPTATRRPSETRPVPPAFRTQRRAAAPPAHGADHEDSTVALDAPAPGRLRPNLPESASTVTAARSSLEERRASRATFDVVPADAALRSRDAFTRLKYQLDSRKPKAGRRRWPDAKNDRERRLMAASAFHKGRVFLRAEEAERALPGLHRALELRPQELEYDLYVKWAQILVNDAFKDDARRKEVELLAMRAVRADHLCELGWSVLGHLAHHDGNEEAALRFFQRAAALDTRLVDAQRLAGLLATRQSSEPHLRASIADATERARRGALKTPLDELVPVGALRAPRPDRAGRPPVPRKSVVAAGDLTPRGGLVVEPELVEALAPPLVNPPTPVHVPPVAPRPGAPPPPPPTPSPTSERTLALAPTARAGLAPPPGRAPSVPPPSVRHPGSVLPAPIPPPPRTGTSDPPEATRIMASVPPPSFAAPLAPRMPSLGPGPLVDAALASHAPPRPTLGDLPTGRPRRSGAVVAIVGLVGLAAAAGGAYAFRTQRPHGGPPTTATAASSSAGRPGLPAPTASVLPPATGPTLASATASAAPGPSATAIVATATASAASAAPVTSATVPPAPAPTPATSASAASATSADPAATTGVLRSKAVGHRIFVDGRVAGEAGRDLVVACGAHRVKVGSAGTERSVTIPCGGHLDLD